MKSIGFYVQYRAIFLVAGVLLAHTPAPAAPACGAPGKPACPLQSYMRTRLATALAHRDFRELERRLTQVAEQNPEPRKWHNWNKFALDGARAAREGRLRGVIAACARCHAIYRPEHNIKYRERKLPE
ncbi:MAG: hypothetical protein HYZ29_10935 [Myxococcales bacterium]|nr:hypothetical protein [Myxococcales bacterium]